MRGTWEHEVAVRNRLAEKSENPACETRCAARKRGWRWLPGPM